MPKYSLTGSHPGGNAAASAIHSGIFGIASRNSITRWMTTSRRSAQVAGQATEQRPQHEAHRHPDQADRHRHPGGVDHPREQVASQLVTAEQEQRVFAVPAIPAVHAEQVQPPRRQVPEPVLVAAHQQPQRQPPAGVVGVHSLQGLRIHRLDHGVHERAHRAPFVEHAHPLRARVDEAGVALVRVVRRQELREQRHQVEQRQHHHADQRRTVAQEAAPDELPLGGQFVALGGAGGGSSGGGRARGAGVSHPPTPSGCADRSASAARRTRKSPTTVSMLSRVMMAPARNMSWPRSDDSSSGPMVGRLSTTATMAPPRHQFRKHPRHRAHDRVDRHTHRVLEQQPRLHHALGARRDHVCLRTRSSRVAPHDALQPGDAAEPDYQHRHRQVLQHVHYPRQRPVGVEVFG